MAATKDNHWKRTMKDNMRKTLAVLALAAAFGSALAQIAPPAGGPPVFPDDRPGQGLGRRPMGGPRDGMRWLLHPRVRAELRLTPRQVEQIQALMPPAPRDRRNGPGIPSEPRDDRGLGDPGSRTPPAGANPPAGGVGTPPPIGAGGPPAGPGTPPPGGSGDGPRGPEQGDRPAAPRLGPDPMEARLRTILRPEQFERFNQLRLQREGVRAMMRPEFAKELGLTESQREKLRGMLGRPFDFEDDEAPRPPERQGDDRTPPPADGGAGAPPPPKGGAAGGPPQG